MTLADGTGRLARWVLPVAAAVAGWSALLWALRPHWAYCVDGIDAAHSYCDDGVFSVSAQLGIAGLLVLLVAYSIVVVTVKRRPVRIAGIVVIAVAMLASLALLEVPLEEVPLTIVD
ncbi:MAG: hypothetical protein ABI566_14045 [Pseudolysinimonas sp.]